MINFELSDVSETYVHRIGRTGRAGQKELLFRLLDGLDLSKILEIQEKLIGKKIPVVKNILYHQKIW